MGSDEKKEAMDAAVAEIRAAEADTAIAEKAFREASVAVGAAQTRASNAMRAFTAACREYAGLPPPELSRDDADDE